MSNSHVVPPSSLAMTDAPVSNSSLGGSLALVVMFWWAATGVTLAMQRSVTASRATVVVASVLAVVGAALIARSRNETTVRSARLAFLGSSLIWWWCSSLFYSGIGINITPAASGGPRTWALAMDAILATLRADLIGVAALVAVAMTVWSRRNRYAFWTLVAYWGTLQTAKLNVFMGVKNSGADWLPEHLERLSQFFGPPVNSWLLPVTLLILSAAFVAVTRYAQAAASAFAKHALSMLALLLGLAVIEHAFLGLTLTLRLWDFFMPGAG